MVRYNILNQLKGVHSRSRISMIKYYYRSVLITFFWKPNRPLDNLFVRVINLEVLSSYFHILNTSIFLPFNIIIK